MLLAAGLATRYVLRMPKTGAALLLCEPLLEVVLLVATAVDLRSGAEPSWRHGLAALYIGYTAGHGHRTVKWPDGHAAHRFGGAPRPAGPPRYGMASRPPRGPRLARHGGGRRCGDGAAVGGDPVRRRPRAGATAAGLDGRGVAGGPASTD